MIQLLGIPFDANSSFMQGPSLAPDRIRSMRTCGSANDFSELGLEIIEKANFIDLGNIEFKSLDSGEAYKLIKKNVSKATFQDNKLISLGGDHSISFPVIETFAEKYKNLNVLHFDAHSDIYEYFDGNPFSHASPFARLMELGVVNSLTQVGIRTLTTHQKDQIKKYDVKVIEMKNLETTFINQLSAPLYISIDMDVLDPAFAPGVSHIEPGGMSTRELISMIQQIGVEIVGADIVECNPKRDLNDMTAMAAYKILKELIAKMYEGRS